MLKEYLKVLTLIKAWLVAKAPEQAVRAEDAVPRVAALPCAGRGCGALGPDRVSVGPAPLLSAGQEAVRVRAVPAGHACPRPPAAR